MDRVRFGRALGFGARQAVKTLVTAVDAATAENPSAKKAARSANTGQSSPVRSDAEQALKAAAGIAEAANRAMSTARSGAAAQAGRLAPDSAAKKAVYTAAQAIAQSHEVQQGVRRGTRRFGEAVWRPFVRLSGVLWLEVSGVFFGVFALLALGWGWKVRGAWHATAANAADHRRLMGAAIMLVLFGYFCVSSFVRARRRERGR
jgi:hypothetical protein